MVVISLMVSLVFSVTTNHARMAQRSVDRAAAEAYADGVIECLYDQWRLALKTVTNKTDRRDGLSTAALKALVSAPPVATLPAPVNTALVSWDIFAATPLLAPTTDPAGRPVPENGTNRASRTRLHYVARATVSYKGPEGANTLTVQRTFVRAGATMFDKFHEGHKPNIEFHPGAPMYVDGDVYIGGNLFTSHDYLHFLKDVTYTGKHHVNYREEDSRYGKTAPTITNNGLGDNWDLNTPPHQGSEQKLFDTPRNALEENFLDDPIANDRNEDNNTNNDGYHELVEQADLNAPNDPLQLDPDTNERLANAADYRIEVDANNNVKIYRGNPPTPLVQGSPEYLAIRGAITTDTAIKDVRDADNVRIVTVDVDKIRTATDTDKTIRDNAGGVDGTGGDGFLLYVEDTSVGTSVGTKIVNSDNGALVKNVTSGRSRGVKLINGGKLPSKGLTVATPNPVYIQGDYNTGKTASVQPPSNTTKSYVPPADKPSPVVAGYNRASSAVVADAVNILSNNWNDMNSTASKNSRQASNTTVNTAILAGDVPTTTSSYGGGIENFVRFHETWSGDYFTIYGTTALLYASKQATRPWNAADYSPPNRRWYYDPLLGETDPPGFKPKRFEERGRRIVLW